MDILKFSTDLDNVEKNLFSQDLIKKLIEDHQLINIVNLFVNTKSNKKLLEKLTQLFTSITMNKSLYEMLVFPIEKDNEAIMTLLQCNDEDKRQVIPQAVMYHHKQVLEKLNLKYEQKDKQFDISLQVLFHMLQDEEHEVGLKVMETFRKMIAGNCLFIKDQLFLKRIQQGIELKNDIVRLRYMELVIDISNKSQELQQEVIDLKLIDQIFKQFQTNDILVKLNIVEVIQKMGDSEWNSQLLSEHDILDDIIKQAFDKDSEFYVRKYLGLLLAKLIQISKLKLSYNLEKKFSQLVGSLLEQKKEEETCAALEILQYLLVKQEGINLMIKEKPLLTYFCEISKSIKKEEKLKFLNSVVSLLKDVKSKSVKNIVAILLSIGQVDKIKFMDFNNPSRIEDLKLFYEFLFNYLLSPFYEFELSGLEIILNMLQSEIIMRYFVMEKKSVEYFARKICNNKQVSDMKQYVSEQMESVFNSYGDDCKDFLVQVKILKDKGGDQELSYLVEGA